MSVSDFPVFRNPGQLLRFLGLSGPDAPSRVSDVVQGHVDLLPWWLASTEGNLVGTITPGVGVTTYVSIAALVVPSTQRWIVTGFTVANATNAAGHTLRYTPAYQTGVPANAFALGTPQQFGPAEFGAVDAFQGAGRNGWLLLGPGDSCGAYFHNNVGAAPAVCTATLRYTSFPV